MLKIASVIAELKSICKGFSRWKRNFRSSPDWLRQEFDWQMDHPITCQVFFWKCPPFSKQFPIWFCVLHIPAFSYFAHINRNTFDKMYVFFTRHSVCLASYYPSYSRRTHSCIYAAISHILYWIFLFKAFLWHICSFVVLCLFSIWGIFPLVF